MWFYWEVEGGIGLAQPGLQQGRAWVRPLIKVREGIRRLHD